MNELNLPFLNDYKIYLGNSIEPLHKMMRKNEVESFENV